jgi:hypothetical protein
MFEKEFLESDERPYLVDIESGPVGFEQALSRVDKFGECYGVRLGITEILLVPSFVGRITNLITKESSISFRPRLFFVSDDLSHEYVDFKDNLSYFLYFQTLPWFRHTDSAPEILSSYNAMEFLRQADPGTHLYHPDMKERMVLAWNKELGFHRFSTRTDEPISKEAEEFYQVPLKFDWAHEVEENKSFYKSWTTELYFTDYWTTRLNVAYYDWEERN